MFNLNDSVVVLPGISEKSAEKLAMLHIFSVNDLLYHFPFRYEDSSDIKTIEQVLMQNLTEATVKVTIKTISNAYLPGRKKLTRATAVDSTGRIDIIWFNQQYLTTSLPPGTQVVLSGKCKLTKTRIQFVSPIYEIDKGETKHVGRITGVYPETFGINSKWLRSKIDTILKGIKVTDTFPKEIIKKYEFLDLKSALTKIHFPENQEDIEKSRERLGFEELYYLQLKVLQKNLEEERFLSKAQNIHSEEINKFLSSLKFTPTNAQIRSVQEILADTSTEKAMNRLLEGDVGSGKTLVASVVALNTVLNGKDVAIMAPTTILAEQHLKTFEKFLPHISIQLLTTHTSKGVEKSDKPTIYIGTQALIFNGHILNNLGLVIIDEQHRFGVKQRDFLAKFVGEDQTVPHFLTMTATPIPRTLAQTLFGDIEVSILDELPANRIPIDTYIVTEPKRHDSYEFVKKEIAKQNQVFVICPLIEESEAEKMKEVKSAVKEFEEIKENFPNAKVELVHGRMKEVEKSDLLTRFRNKDFDILVSTSVVEVGIDIPDATVIMIESAERFGLAQLHQLRGRVGRNDKKSFCLLYKTNPGKNDRLEFFSKHNKGIELAEFDLQNRGPGEVYGLRQSGIPTLKIANILDIETVKKTREEAKKTLSI